MRTFIIICLLLFSIYPTLIDVFNELTGNQWNGLSTIGMYGSQWGYTIVNFLLMYMVGAYLRLSDFKIKKWKTGKMIGLWVVGIILLTMWAGLDMNTAWEYCNPLVILSSVLSFIMFSKIQIGTNKKVNKMAEGVFSIFLLHGVFLPYIGIKRAVTGNAIMMLLHILFSVVCISIGCLCIHFVYKWISKPIFRWLENKIVLPYIDLERQ